ncbi:MAG: hypothetical protein QM737_09935 [Ferruginibacter sp.]
MDIKNNIYVKFYMILAEHFYNEYHKKKGNIALDKALLWNLKRDKNGNAVKEPIALSLFDLGSDQTYFHRKYKEAIKPEYVPVREISLYKALHEIGFRSRDKDKFENALIPEKAQMLFNEFLFKYFPSEIDSKNIEIKPESTDTLNNPESFFEKNPEVKQTILLYQKFLKHIEQDKFYDAWLFLSPMFQDAGIWDRNFFVFESSFKTWRPTQGKLIFHNYGYKKIEIETNSFEKRERFDFKELPRKLAQLTQKNDGQPTRLLSWIIETINSRLNEYNLPGLEEIDQSKLDEDDVQRLILSNPFMQPNVFSFLNKPQTYEIPINRKITFIYRYDRWLIDRCTNLTINFDKKELNE